MRLALLLALVACEAAPPSPAPAKITSADSNIFARDYVGPAACGECHADEYARWSGSLHKVMNQAAGADSVIGDFSGKTLAYAGGEVQFGPGLTMTMRKGDAARTYRVTRTIGRRGLQEYVGVDGDGPEVRLPFGWWPAHGGWAPQVAFDPWLAETRFDPYAPVAEPWAARCPWCHSTYPFAQRIARSDAKGVGHGHELAVSLDHSIPYDNRLDVAQQVTVGISCESCHLGGRAHAMGGPIHLVPRGAASSSLPDEPFAAERADARIVNETCAQCHSGPSPRLADGTALRNSSEAIDLAASPCTGIKCTDCHDPHAGGADETRALAACTRCHDRLADAASARTHAGHTSTTCLDCHMPKIVMGLDRFVRTHRISSPTDARVLATGPNACNVCHLDRSLSWTLAQLASDWDVHPDVTPDERPAGEAWLAGKPAMRLIATAAYASRPVPSLRALVEQGRSDPSSYVRAWTAILVDRVAR